MKLYELSITGQPWDHNTESETMNFEDQTTAIEAWFTEVQRAIGDRLSRRVYVHWREGRTSQAVVAASINGGTLVVIDLLLLFPYFHSYLFVQMFAWFIGVGP